MRTARFQMFFKLLLCIATIVFAALSYWKYQAVLHPIDHHDKPFDEWMRKTTKDLTIRRKQWWNIVRENEDKDRISRVPDVIGIGVRKCGTGMLQNFISRHPLIRQNLSEVHYYDRNMHAGLEYYKSHLPDAAADELILEKTPAYFTTLPYNLPDIIANDSPQVKIFLILCDPVKRAFSDYVMRTLHGSKKAASKTFDQYVEYYLPRVQSLFSNATMNGGVAEFEHILKSLRKDRCMYSFGHGIYAYFIRRWLEGFAPDRLIVIDGENFLNDPGTVIEQLQEFLEIPKLLLKRDYVKHPESGMYCIRKWWNESYNLNAEFSSVEKVSDWICSTQAKGITRSQNATYTLSKAALARLKVFFSPYNEMLFNMLGTRFNW